MSRRSFGDLVAVDGLSFSVSAGRLFGFVGRNGAGKTTTMRIICGLLAADGGDVTWRDAPIDASVRERIGYMPEERGLYPKMRVGDQLEYFAVLHGAPHGQARAAARSWLDRLGLRDRVGARVEELSQGNQQRVQLAAALVHHPDLLILDEPFAGLDPIVTDLLPRCCESRRQRGVPVLFSSHQLELVEHICESVAIIDRGRLVACGQVDELRAGGPRLVRIDVAERRPTGSTRSRTSSSWSAQASGTSSSSPRRRILSESSMRRAGPGSVTHFAELQPTLAELFRELVSP